MLQGKKTQRIKQRNLTTGKKSQPKRTWTSPSLAVPAQLKRRNTVHDFEDQSKWLETAASLWSSDLVCSGKSSVDVDNLSLNSSPFHRKKKRDQSVEKTIEYLEQLPWLRSKEEQRQIETVADLILPLASAEQVVRLESLVSLEVAQLYAALEEQDLMAILNAPTGLWKPNMIEQLIEYYENDFLCALVARWAAVQKADCYLREDSDPLVWFLQKLIQNVGLEIEPELEPKAFINQACKIWRKLPRNLLIAIQTALPVQEADGLPTLLHVFLFRLASKTANAKTIFAAVRQEQKPKALTKASAIFEIFV